MAITIAFPKETIAGEKRIAITPALVNKFKKLGAEIKIQAGAGETIFAADSAFKGAEFLSTAKEIFAAGDVVVKVQPPTKKEIGYMKEGAALISMLYAHTNKTILKELNAKKITCFALEMIPRISRAQSMDILSTQATVLGYKSVLLAANSADFFLPMLSTAGGTIRPSIVLIIGVGVAGLQAIATARRLGGRVEAYDIRPETKEEIESLGAKAVDTGITVQAEGGYARELTAQEKQKQKDVLAKHVAAADIIISTAGVPGKPAPKIITKDMVEAMKPGSVIVDAVAEMGGNCELTKANETVEHNLVKVIGPINVASSMAVPSSEMFAKNVLNFMTPMFDEKEKKFNIPWDDEVIIGSNATRDGSVMLEALKNLEA